VWIGASSGGHVAPGTPEHRSLRSQLSPEPTRQTVDEPFTTFVGHGCPGTPVQVSFGSQTSPEPLRQSVPEGVTTFVGHATPGWPLHVSSGSQMSAEPTRHVTIPAFPGASSAGHVALVPVQVSFRSQGAPPPGRQTLPPARNWQAAVQQLAAVPLLEPWSHCSPDSTIPFPQAAAAMPGPTPSATRRARLATGRAQLGFIE
jgi:hypothetical protein